MYAWYRWYKEFDDPLDYMESLVLFVFDFRDPLFWAIVLLGNSIFIVCMLSLFTGLCCSCRKIHVLKQNNTNKNDELDDYDYDSNGTKIAAASPASQRDAVNFEYGSNNINNVEMASIDVEIQREMRQQSVHSQASYNQNQYAGTDGPGGGGGGGGVGPGGGGGGAGAAYAFSGHYAPDNPYGRIDRGNSNGGVSIGESEPGMMIQAQASYENRYVGTSYNPDFANSPHSKAPPINFNNLTVNTNVHNNNNSSRHVVNDNSAMYSDNAAGLGGNNSGEYISEYEGYYKHGYLIILNIILILATAIYEWVVTPQTSIKSSSGINEFEVDGDNFHFVYDTDDDLYDFMTDFNTYEKFIMAMIGFSILRIICKFFARLIDRHKDNNSASVQVFVELFFAALYYYTLRILFTDWNAKYIVIAQGQSLFLLFFSFFSFFFCYCFVFLFCFQSVCADHSANFFFLFFKRLLVW